MKKIVCIKSNVFCNFPEFSEIKNKGYSFVFLDSSASEDEILTNIRDAEGCIISGSGYLSENIIKNSKELKFISFLGIGYGSYIDANAATANGIAVMNTPGGNANAVAELAIGLTLNFLRSITYLNNYSKKFELKSSFGAELSSLTVGLFGMGNICQRISSILVNGFGSKVVYFNRTRREDSEKSLGISYLSKDELLKTSDVVIMALPDTPDTRGTITEKELNMMKKGAFLVNVGRAMLIDGASIANALKNNVIAGFATDIHYIDPLPKNKSEDEYDLMSLSDDKFIVMPHIGAATAQAVDNIYKITDDNISEFINNGECKNIVNPDYRQNIK